jgi:hypothetical protein
MLRSEGWVLGCKTVRKRIVSSRGFSGQTELTSRGLELQLTGVERWLAEGLVAVVEEEGKGVSLVPSSLFIGDGVSGRGWGPSARLTHCQRRRGLARMRQGAWWRKEPE